MEYLRRFADPDHVGFPNIRGTSSKKDWNILGSKLRSPYVGKLPC